MKIRISADGEGVCNDCAEQIHIDPTIYIEDILLPSERSKVDLSDLIGKTIIHIEESEKIKGALILTLE